MNEDHIRNVVEAALLAAGRPLGLAELAQLFDEDARPTPVALREALGRIADDHTSRALELREVASGWRLQVRASGRSARSAIRARCSRRSRSSPTGSPSPVPRSRRSAASP